MMKNKLLFILASVLMMFTCFGCVSYSENEFNELSEQIKSKSDTWEGGAIDACPIGRWVTPTCNGTNSLVYYFGSNGEGYSQNPECNGICTPMIFRFKYSVSGNRITYNFTSTDNVICSGSSSKPNVPSGTFTITYTCADNGNKLITETSNINTGVRTTTTFTRAGTSTPGTTPPPSGSTPPPTNTPPAKGKVLVWTDKDAKGWAPTGWKGSGTGAISYMQVSVYGSNGTIYAGKYTSAPACGATYCFTKELDPGTYTVRGTVYFLKDIYGNSYSNYSTSQTFTVYSNQCTKVVLR